MKLLVSLLLCAGLAACGSTPQEREASAAAFGAVLGGAAAAAGAYADARYNRPYVAPVVVQPVYVAPVRPCWRSAVTGQLVC